MWTTERDDEWDEPDSPHPYVDGAWGRTANPNTVEGELQNLAVFGNGIARLPRPHRIAAKVVVWLILLGTLLTIVYGMVGIVRVW